MSKASFANVTALLALVVALSGSAYAVANVGSRDVIDESLRSRDLRDGVAVRTEDVRNDDLKGGGLTFRRPR